MRVLRMILVLALCSASGLARGLPAELQHLEDIEQNEQAVIDAARRFDLQQKALIDWDKRLFNEYVENGEPDLAATKQADINRRADLLRDLWQWVLARYPNNARANNYYGEYLYDYEGRIPEALQYWQTAVRLDDEFAPVHNNLGLHYFHTGNYAQGLTQLERALELDEDNPDYLYNMAQMYLVHFPQIGELKETSREKLYNEAMKMSRRAAELAPNDFDIVQDYAVNFYAAENFGLQVDWEEAAHAWEKAVAVARTEGERYFALLNEGRAWLRSPSPEKAVAPLEVAVGLRTDNQSARQLLAKAKEAVK